MNNILKVTKYQLLDYRKAVMIYYLVILALGFIVFSAGPNGQTSFGGAAFVFLFVLGLNTFKSSFKFMQANNVSRKTFYLGTIIAITVVSLIMSLGDAILESIFTSVVNYSGFFEQVYQAHNSTLGLFSKFIWNLTLFIMSTSIGFIITMIYYRANKIMKILISLVPVVGIFLFGYLNSLSDGGTAEAIIDFIGKALGLTGNYNPYIAVMSFTIISISVLSLNYLLVIGAPIKD